MYLKKKKAVLGVIFEGMDGLYSLCWLRAKPHEDEWPFESRPQRQGRVLQVIYQRIGRGEIRLDMEMGVSVPAINRSEGVHGKS